MSGKLPIDRVRDATHAPKVLEEHRQTLTQARAKLEQTDEPAEGERRPEPDGDETERGTRSERPQDSPSPQAPGDGSGR